MSAGRAWIALATLTLLLAAAFLAISVIFVWRSFYGMRIGGQKA